MSIYNICDLFHFISSENILCTQFVYTKMLVGDTIGEEMRC